MAPRVNRISSIENSYAGTNSIFTLRPKARAALPSVFSVTEEFDASSNRSTAARLVFMRAAICVLVNSLFFQEAIQLQTQRLFQRAGLDFAQDALFFQEIPEVTATMISFAHRFCRYCLLRFFANSSSPGGVFCCFLMKPSSSPSHLQLLVGDLKGSRSIEDAAIFFLINPEMMPKGFIPRRVPFAQPPTKGKK